VSEQPTVSEQKVMALAQDLFRADFPHRSMPGPNSPVAHYYIQCAQAKLAETRKPAAPVRAQA
jgi:hypothetical protein